MNTVLVATERDLEQNLIAQALGTRGFAVIRSRDGLEALESARANPPHIFVANVSLPRMDGFALFRRCRQDEQLQGIPFILYSPRSNDEKSERFALELGATRFVSNALKPETLLRAVEEVLASRTAQLAVNQSHGVVQLVQPVARVISLEVRQWREQNSRLQQELQTSQTQLQVMQQQLQAAQLQAQNVQTQLADANHATQFITLFNTNPVAMWLVDKVSHAMLAVNEAALRLFGYSHTEFLQLNNEQLLHHHAVASTSTTVMAFQHRDGRALSLLLNSREVAFADHSAELITAHDVSYRVRGERAIVDEVQRVKALLTAIPLPYWVLDGDANVLDVNELYCQQSGYRREELIGQPLASLLAETPDTLPFVVTASNPATSQAVTLKYKDGSSHPAALLLAQAEHGAPRIVLIQARSEPANSSLITESVATHLRLSTVLEMLRYADDADEATLLQYAVAQLAAAFASPIALFAAVDRSSQSLTIMALSQSLPKRTANSTLTSIPLPTAWREVFTQRRAELRNALPEITELEGLPPLTPYLACPVSSGREQCLMLIANRDSAYSAAERQELTDCAEILAAVLSLKRQQLHTDGLQQRAQAGAAAMLNLLNRLLDRHDPFAAGSNARVTSLAMALARELDLPAERHDSLRLAAQLHDVGHLLTPQALLLRPTDLTAAECALLETHAEQGAQLLTGLELGADIATIVAQHHERMDGSGYPRGLQSADILLEARIIAVADAVEAMCATRAYRAALGLSAALAELAKGSGRTYDAAVVAACLRLFDTTKQQWPS